jgi:hypothetical protein
MSGRGNSIPEMLGFSSVPYDREKKYSVDSYRALYALTEEEAQEARDSHATQPEIDIAMSHRYMKDAEYRARVDERRAPITATPPNENVKRLMLRLMDTMPPPNEEARRQMLRDIGKDVS